MRCMSGMTIPPDLVAGTIHKPFDVDLIVDTVAACITTRHKVERFDDCPDQEGLPNEARPS